MEFIIKFIKDFITIIGEMAPYLLLGFFFAGLLYAFIPRNKIEKYFNGGAFKSSVLASLFGVPLPLCSCGVIPTGTAFYKNGASKGGTISFLISTPQTGIDSILATFSLLGLPFAILRPIAALVTGITGGLITAKVTKNEVNQIEFTESDAEKKTLKEKVIDVFQYGFIDFVQDIAKWLTVGLVLAALISAVIPDDFVDLLNLAPLVQMLIILVVSIPLYICATGSIPLAAILILKGISPGAAFVLLMAGPATNAATITMIGKVLGRKSLFSYLATIIVGALITGILIDYVLPIEWFTSFVNQSMHGAHHIGLNWIQISSGIILSGLLVFAFYKKYNSKSEMENKDQNENNMKEQLLKVEGMTCNHCKMNVENNLKKLESIDNAIVNLNDKTVTIQGDSVNVDNAKDTINGLGYKVVE